MVVVNPDVDMYLTNSSGQKAGSNGTTTYTDIPNAVYYLQHGIKDPVSGKTSPDFKMLLIPTPNNDTYNITVATTSAAPNDYKLELYRYTATGSATVNKISNSTRVDEPGTESFSYQQSPTGSIPAPVDTTPPQIKSAKTLDTNNNGKIDTIEVTFVRDVNGATVNSTGTDFLVSGYTVTHAQEISPGVVRITVTEKATNDTGTTPIITLVNNGIKDITSDTYNHQQTSTPVDAIAPTKPTVSVPGGSYTSPQQISLTSSDNPGTPTILFTVDGSDPATSSAKLTYASPITINASSITLRAIAKDSAGNISSELTQTYEIAPAIDASSIQVATPSATSFTVSWTTDRPSYGRVILGRISKAVLGSGTKYGYDTTTNETATKTLTHTVILSGLTPGATYYYRVISRGSPEQVSSEKTVSLPADTSLAAVTTTTNVLGSSTASSTSSSSSSSSNSSASSNSSCNDAKPGSAPTLISAFPGINTVTLSWKAGSDPISYYLVAYGTKSGSLQFGNPNIGGKGTTSFVVDNLSGGQTYYFKVRAGNGCAPGDYSNEISATPIGFAETGNASGFLPNVLGAKTEKVPFHMESGKAKTQTQKVLAGKVTPKSQENVSNEGVTIALVLALSGILASTSFWLFKKLRN